jgi:hypothetical protein
MNNKLTETWNKGFRRKANIHSSIPPFLLFSLITFLCVFAPLRAISQYSYTQITKHYNATTADSGVYVWTPDTGNRLAITSVEISTYDTTTARLILWIGPDSVAINDSVNVLDSIYTVGVDQPVVIATFSPSSTSNPVLVYTPAAPIICNRTNRRLKVTTDAALSFDIIFVGYEW